jgi:hypothetical protein
MAPDDATGTHLDEHDLKDTPRDAANPSLGAVELLDRTPAAGLQASHAAASISSRAVSNCTSVRRICECRQMLCGNTPAASTGGA